MRLKLDNILILAGIIVILVLLGRNGHAIFEAFGSISRMGPGSMPEEKITGCFTIGFIGVAVVAIVRIIASFSRRNRLQDRDED